MRVVERGKHDGGWHVALARHQLHAPRARVGVETLTCSESTRMGTPSRKPMNSCKSIRAGYNGHGRYTTEHVLGTELGRFSLLPSSGLAADEHRRRTSRERRSADAVRSDDEADAKLAVQQTG